MICAGVEVRQGRMVRYRYLHRDSELICLVGMCDRHSGRLQGPEARERVPRGL